MSNGTSRGRRRLGVLLSLFGACAPAICNGTPDGYSEDSVKAVFLARFPGYVEWPPTARTQFTIAVLGADGVAAELQRVLPNFQVARLQTQVRKIRRIDELGDAQMLFVGRESPVDLRLIVAATSARPVLLVTDDEHGLDLGSAVNFLLVDQRVRFEVSVLAAERSGLTISSELLSVAARVQGGRRRTDMTCGASGGIQEHGGSCTPRLTADAGGASAASGPNVRPLRAQDGVQQPSANQ